MQIQKGNIWDHWSNTPKHRGCPICVTTNGILDRNGDLVMGRGIALEAKQKCPKIAQKLGQLVQLYGNLPFYLEEVNIISFPTKHHWKDKSDIRLIISSALKIKEMIPIYLLRQIYSVWPGCSNGGLTVEVVKPVLEDIWRTDTFIIIDKQ